MNKRRKQKDSSHAPAHAAREAPGGAHAPPSAPQIAQAPVPTWAPSIAPAPGPAMPGFMAPHGMNAPMLPHKILFIQVLTRLGSIASHHTPS